MDILLQTVSLPNDSLFANQLVDVRECLSVVITEASHDSYSIRKRYMSLYRAVSSPLDHSKRFTLSPPPGRPVHSDTNSASPRSILARQQLRAKTKSLTFPPLSIARYSFIQLSQQGRHWRERKCPIFEKVDKGIRTRAHLIVSPAFYNGGYGAPRMAEDIFFLSCFTLVYHYQHLYLLLIFQTCVKKYMKNETCQTGTCKTILGQTFINQW